MGYTIMIRDTTTRSVVRTLCYNNSKLPKFMGSVYIHVQGGGVGGMTNLSSNIYLVKCYMQP